MSVDLNDYVGSLKRQITPPGGTAANVTDSAWAQYLVDAFWQARLDGLLEGFTVDEDGVVTPLSGSTDIDLKYVALVTLYAAIQILRLQVLNTNTGLTAKAGPVDFELQKSAAMLVEMLKQLRLDKQQILSELDSDAAGHTPTYYLDALSVRTFEFPSYWGSLELT